MTRNLATLDIDRARALGEVTGPFTRNRVLRNTFTLLGITLAWGALCAGAALAFGAPAMPWWVTLGGYFGLLFLVHALRDRASGIGAVFALTGFLGFTLGPLVGHYLAAPNGPVLVAGALGATGVLFVGLAGYALASRRDFSFMGGFLLAGMIVAVLASVGAIVFSLPALSLAVAAAVVLMSCGFVLFQTSLLVNEGETNYLLATVALYATIFNLFASLLQLLGAFGQEE